MTSALSGVEQAVTRLKETGSVLGQLRSLARVGSLVARFDGSSDWSPEVYDLLGLPHDSATSFDIFLSRVHPDDRQALISDMMDAQRAKPEVTQRRLEFRVVAGDSVRCVEAHREVLRDEQGAPLALVAVLQDVTARIEMESRLRESEARFRALVESGSDGIAMLDTDGQILYASRAACEILGEPPGALTGLNVRTFCTPDERDGFEAAWKAVLDSPGIPINRQTRFLRRNGTIREIEVTRTNHLADPTLHAIVSNFRDITERVLIEAEFRQAQKMEAVGRLAGGVAHDFNNLMTVVLSYASIVSGELPADDPIREDLAEISRAGGRATALTRQLLAFSRRQVLQPKHVDLVTLVGEAEKMLRRLVGERVQLAITSGPAPIVVHADPGAIEQCLMNLVVNARDAMQGNGTLAIDARTLGLPPMEAKELGLNPGMFATIAVRDSGCGMDAATLSRIFEPFFTTKEKGKGTGLGLSTVFGIVKQSRGGVSVVSSPGNGSTFTLFFPLSGEISETTDPGIRVAFEKKAPTNVRVLLVEDEPAVREVARRGLVLAGYDVTAAAGPGEALLIAEKAHFDLLLTDVVMPWMSGPELAARLRRDRPDLRVLFASGYADPAAEGAALSGDAILVSKPLTPETLTAAVERALRQK